MNSPKDALILDGRAAVVVGLKGPDSEAIGSGKTALSFEVLRVDADEDAVR